MSRPNTYVNNHNSSHKWDEVRKEAGYGVPIPGMRKKAFKTQDVIIDKYTGRALPKDGRAHLDHIVSVKEIERNAATNLHMTPEQRAKMATQDSNLAWTKNNANQSKGDKAMEEWLDTPDKKTGTTKGERFEIDIEMAMEKDKAARKSIKKEINKESFKNYSKELLKTGVKDAAKMATYSAIQ